MLFKLPTSLDEFDWSSIQVFRSLSITEDNRFHEMFKTRNQKRGLRTLKEQANKDRFYLIDRFISDNNVSKQIRDQISLLENN